MTDRKFTPPTEFPAEYVTRSGRKAVILGRTPCDQYPLAGYVQSEFGQVMLCSWTADGLEFDGAESSNALHDLPTKRVHWANDYGSHSVSRWHLSRSHADRVADSSRIAVIRREWVEGQPPQYFTEEV